MSNKMTLSVTIITKNEEDRIRCCLDSVKGLADEIIVLDSGSMDRTLEIVAEYTDKIYKTDWPGFGIQKQRALEKASCDWVLAIDADEALDEAMQQWLLSFLITDRHDVAGVKMPWGVMAYGKRLDYGRSARAPLRMAWREGAKFTDAEVHEEFIPATGEIAIAQGRLLHYSNRDYGHALQKNIDYAWLGSQKYFRQGKRCNSLTLATLRSLWTFVHIYIVRGGILDGPVGYLVAINYAQNNFHKYTGLWTLTRAEKKCLLRRSDI
ncbi:MAG: glycosyltransferase family 2 protein [Pseudomonadales bacterium]|nr:glycosyltransferase family 2 protein [Pseudomonadales bacterium]